MLFVGPLEAFIWLTRCPFVDMLTISTAYCMSVPIYSMSARSVGINLPQVGRTAVLSQSLEEDSTRGRLSSSRQAASSLKYMDKSNSLRTHTPYSFTFICMETSSFWKTRIWINLFFDPLTITLYGLLFKIRK